MSEKLLTHLFDAEPPKNRRDEAISTVVSVLGHMLVLALFLLVAGGTAAVATTSLGVGDGIGAGLAGGGGGGGAEDAPVAISVQAAPPPPQPVPEKPFVEPIPVPTPEIKPVEIPQIALPALDSIIKPATVVATGGTGTGTNTGNGSGNGSGTGGGSGTGSGGGDGDGIGSGRGSGTGKGRMLAPSPEILLIPPPAPGGVRGKTVVVRLDVDSAGVVRGAEVIPSTGDRKYDSALKRVALGWRFRPARDAENRPVATPFDVTFTFD